MTKRHFFGGVALVCASILGAATITAQDAANQAGQDEAMAKYMAYATPGKQHEKLAKREGTWDLEVKQWMAPGAPPEVSSAVAEFSLLLDGRYLLEHVEGTAMNMPFEGYGITGYDNVKKQFVSTWIDSMGTGIMTGSYKARGNGLEGYSTGTDPMTGGDMKMRSVETRIDDNSFKVEMFSTGPGNTEHKGMEIVYTRK